MKSNNQNKIIVAVSGGFDPIHIGHVRLFQEAKKLGDELVVILNNDNWLVAKKGSAFMPELERKEILEALSSVDRVVVTQHPPNPKDMSVCYELEKLRPHIFANGGDRYLDNIPEVATCQAIGCKMVFNVGKGGKVQSSSWLLDKHARESRLRDWAGIFSSKKVIVFDLDGTLTKSKSNLDQEMAQLLYRLLEIKKIAVISGGNYTQFQSQFLNYLKCQGDRLKNLLILPTSGGELHQYQKGKWRQVYKHILTSAEKKKIFNAFEKAFRDISYQKPRKTYGRVIEDRQSQITFSALGQKAPLAEKKKWNKKQDIRKELQSALKKYLPQFEIRLGGLTSIDITKKGINKAYGVTQIMKLLKVKKRDLLYVGDALYKGGNDFVVKKTGIATLAVKNEAETKIFIRSLIRFNEEKDK
ncbi:MAG: D-beta-D-heptose 1-phosphate adenylyltransferase [Syntrophomonadaceae bacterium]|nr:D-beta-D-heptose 1-phosphate adenylyltransferase [Bacillota bacterium]